MTTEWSRELLYQSGVLYQASSSRGGVVCVDVRGSTLLLAPITGFGEKDFEVAQEARLEVVTSAGILRVRGTLAGVRQIEINGVPQRVALLEATLEEIERVNRRAHHRVSVTLKGTLTVLEPAEVDQIQAGNESAPGAWSRIEALADTFAERSRSCVVRDLGLGGARLVTVPPRPERGAFCFFDLALGPEQKLRCLPARIIEVRPLSDTPPPEFEIRMRFEGLARSAEAQLSRYLTKRQLELLRKGIRS